jgi:hypothetical protein
LVINNDPKIIRVNSEIYDYQIDEEIPVIISFDAYLEDFRTANKVVSIAIEDPEGVAWNWNRTELDKNWDSKRGCYKLYYIKTSLHKDHIPLGVYKLSMKIINNSVDVFLFTIYGRSDINMINGSIYSLKSSDEPKIILNPEIINIKKENDYVLINFNNKDEIVNDCFLWLYNEKNEFIKSSKWLSVYNQIKIGDNEIKIPAKDLNDFNYCKFIISSKKTAYNNTVIYNLVIDRYYLN